MAKLSLLPKDATKGGGFGAQEGFWEVGKAYSTVYQFPASEDMKAKNEEYPPSCQVILELFKLDPKSYERIDDEPVFERLGFGGKNGLDKVRPGKMDSPADDEPEDLGTDLGVEGNSVYCEEGTTLADNCAWIIFSKDLEARGFKPEMIGSGWLPHLEGTKFEVERHKAYKNPNKTYKSDPTNLGVKKIITFGYEVKKGKGKAAAKPAAGAAAAAGKAAAGAAAGANGAATGATGDATQIALSAVLAIAGNMKGKPAMKRALFQAQVMTYLMKEGAKIVPDMKSKNDLMNATVKDDEWLANVAAENGFVVDFTAEGGKGTLEFPAE